MGGVGNCCSNVEEDLNNVTVGKEPLDDKNIISAQKHRIENSNCDFSVSQSGIDGVILGSVENDNQQVPITSFLSNIPELVEGDKRFISADDPEELNPGTKYSGDVIYV